MQFYACILLIICLAAESYSFAVDFQSNELTNPNSNTKIPGESQTYNETTPILAVNDFLIDGDEDYEVNDADGADEFDDADADADEDADEDADADYYDGRIVGGSAVSIQQFPYQVSLQQNKAHICGGTIVATSLVITAAHCVERPMNPNIYRIRVGSSQHKHGGQLVGVKRIIRHEFYSQTTLDNDVAIIVLAAKLSFNQNVKAIHIAKQNDVIPAKRRLFISGWGLTSETGSVMPVLRYVTVRLLSETACAQNYKAFTRITSRMFCAGSARGGRDSCQGDSGGPLVSYVNGKPKLFGIVSWGVGCAQKGFPGVYAKVSALRPWINGKIKELRIAKTADIQAN